MATVEATHGDAQPAPFAAGKRRREAGHTPRPTPAALGNAEKTMATVMGTGPRWGESPGATWAVAQAQGETCGRRAECQITLDTHRHARTTTKRMRHSNQNHVLLADIDRNPHKCDGGRLPSARIMLISEPP